MKVMLVTKQDLYIVLPGVLVMMTLFLVFYGLGIKDFRDVHSARVVATLSDPQEQQLPVPRVLPQSAQEAHPFQTGPFSSVVVLDLASGEVMLAHNPYRHRAVASVTKLLASMVVVDQVRDVKGYISVPPRALSVEGSRVGCKNSFSCEGVRLQPGERISVYDLLQATLISSANDAVTALAVHIAGSEASFATLMNTRARELGMTSSFHCRPSGLPMQLVEREERCYSTAYDMAHILRHIYTDDKYEVLRPILEKQQATIASQDGAFKHQLTTTNQALGADNTYIVGGKTGYTQRAGPSLAVLASDQKKEHPIIVAVFNDEQRFARVGSIAAWVYENFRWL